MAEIISNVMQSGLIPWMVLFAAIAILLREAWRVSEDVFWGDSFADDLED